MKEPRELQNSQKTINKMAVVHPYLSISLNINKINPAIKKHRVSKWILKFPLYAAYKRLIQL